MYSRFEMRGTHPKNVLCTFLHTCTEPGLTDLSSDKPGRGYNIFIGQKYVEFYIIAPVNKFTLVPVPGYWMMMLTDAR